MTRKEFESVVTRLERTLPGQMQSYRRKVVLLCLSGYVYILAVFVLVMTTLLVMLGAFDTGGAGVLIVKIGFAAAVVSVTVLRALWVRWPQPDGIPISPDQAPKLFEELEIVRQRLRAPKIHRVFLIDGFNAVMEQRPCLGIFGWLEGEMYIGIQLMQALSPQEFRAVLGHEMGHFSGDRGRTMRWVYRLRQTWMSLLQRLKEEKRFGAWLFTVFFRRYAPFFEAYSFVLARAQECEADRFAAAVAGRDITANALVAIRVRKRFIYKTFWPGLFAIANKSGQLPANFYGRLPAALKESAPEKQTLLWVIQSFAERTDHSDTHPCLSDRLSALGITISAEKWVARLDELALPTAAEELLGSNLEEWYLELYKRWLVAMKPGWEDQCEEILEQRDAIAELRRREAIAPLNPQETWDLAGFLNTVEGDDAAFPIYERITEASPHYLSASFQIGRILLSRGDAAGLSRLHNAMVNDSDFTPGVCQAAEEYFHMQGNFQEAARFRQLAAEYTDLSQKADEERRNFTPEDIFVPHGLGPEVIEQIRQCLNRQKHLKAAFLVRKTVKVFIEKPVYVLGLVREGIANDRLTYESLASLPVGTRFVLLDSKQGALRKKLQAIPDSLVYEAAVR